MSNSPLVTFTLISPNRNSPRNKPISKITIHHMAGFMTVQECGAMFAKTSRQASSNYAIDNNGNVGMYVEEKDRAWTSSSPENDNMAVTIEVANSKGAPNWEISDIAMSKLIDLCVDICRRNNIKELNYTGDKSGNLTMHKWFASTACPGPYLSSKFPYIASEVNKRLGGKPPDGWIKNGNRWQYYENGTVQKNRWVKDGEFWYWVDSTGYMKTGWVSISGKNYLLNPSRVTIGGVTYPTGACIITNEKGEVQ